MDITSLYSIGSPLSIQSSQDAAALKKLEGADGGFDSFLDTAIGNITATNSYLSDAENEEIKWALGESENTHDLTIALEKASTALQYTVALRDKLVEAYKEIINIQI